MTTATEEKPGRLLATGCVQILFCTEGVISARVRGDSGLYDVRWSRLEGWHCTCTCAHFRRCTHIEAVSSVTMRPVTLRRSPQSLPSLGKSGMDRLSQAGGESLLPRWPAPDSQDRSDLPGRPGSAEPDLCVHVERSRWTHKQAPELKREC
jgi:hypothetical protein